MSSLAARAALASVLAAALLAPFASGATTPRSWAKPEIAAVLGAGLMNGDLQTFRPDDPVTQTELDGLIGSLTQQPVPADFTDQPVTMARLDLQLVDALGLGSTAQQFGDAVRAAGLKVPDRFGSEVVARLL